MVTAPPRGAGGAVSLFISQECKRGLPFSRARREETSSGDAAARVARSATNGGGGDREGETREEREKRDKRAATLPRSVLRQAGDIISEQSSSEWLLATRAAARVPVNRIRSAFRSSASRITMLQCVIGIRNERPN